MSIPVRVFVSITLSLAACGEPLHDAATSESDASAGTMLQDDSSKADDDPCAGDTCPAGSECQPQPPEVQCVMAPCVQCVPVPVCDPYPLASEPDPDAQARAQEELDAIAQQTGNTPTMTWSPERGTFQSIFGLQLPLAQCTGSADAGEAVWAAIAPWSALFNFDRTEWRATTPVPCDIIGTELLTLNTTRERIGDNLVLRDSIAFRLRRIDADVVLESVYATFIPPASAHLAARMNGCAELDEELATKLALNTSYEYTVFHHCVPQALGRYAPQPGDTVLFDDEPFWSWWEVPADQHVLLQKYHTGYLIVHPDNYTPELLSSNAACPEEVGFRVTFDAVTGEILYSVPGISCLVC